MIKKTLPFLLAAALGLSASAMVQAAGTAPKSKSVPLSQQVQDLRETVLQLQKQVDYLEMLVPPSTAVLMPDARKLSSIRVNGATFLMSIDKPSGNAKAVILFSLSSTRKALLIPMSLLISACTERTPTGTRTLIKTLCWFPVSRRLSHRARQHSSVLPYRACRLKTSRPLMLLP